MNYGVVHIKCHWNFKIFFHFNDFFGLSSFHNLIYLFKIIDGMCWQPHWWFSPHTWIFIELPPCEYVNLKQRKKSMINLIETFKKCWTVWTFPLWKHDYYSIMYSPRMALTNVVNPSPKKNWLLEKSEEVNQISTRFCFKKREESEIDNHFKYFHQCGGIFFRVKSFFASIFRKHSFRTKQLVRQCWAKFFLVHSFCDE